MITYSEYLDMYIKDFNNYIENIKNNINYIADTKDYNKVKANIFEAEKCVKQIQIEANSLPKGSHSIYEDIDHYKAELKKYKNILGTMSDAYDTPIIKQKEIAKKYIEGSNLLKESEKRAQDVEDMGYTIMNELGSQRSQILRTKYYTEETRQEQSRIKNLLRRIYRDKVLYKLMLIFIIILLVIANIGIIIFKIKK